MDLGVVKTGIESWLNLTAVDPLDSNAPLPVTFDRNPRLIYTKPHVLVRRGPILKVGKDIPKYTYDELTDEYVQQMWGVRAMVIRLAFISFNQDWGLSARQYAEDWRIRAESARSVQELTAETGMALIQTDELVDIDYEWSGHLVSRVETSCRFRLWGYERSAGYDQGYIRSVDLEGSGGIIDEQNNPIVDGDDDYLVPEETMQITVNT